MAIEQKQLLDYQNRESLRLYQDLYSRDILYRDLDLRLIPHPLTAKLNPLEEVDAVKRALVNLILIEPGEKPFDPNFGTPLNALLFDLNTLNPLDLEDQIERSIRLYEPRVRVREIKIDNYPDQNGIEINISFPTAILDRLSLTISAPLVLIFLHLPWKAIAPITKNISC